MPDAASDRGGDKLRADSSFLIADGVRKSFGGLLALDVDRVDVARGQITSLIGPNGAGKTTLFNVLTGFQSADAGTVTFAGDDVTGTPPYRRARLGMIRTFQLTRVMARMSVLDNLKVAAPHQRGERFGAALVPAVWRSQDRDIEQRANEELDRFGLTRMRGELAGSLSGGQRKLLELARAMMLDPTLLMLDEPMAGVNTALRERLLEHIRRLRDDGVSVFFIEHDMDVVTTISDRIICMNQGRVIADDSPAEIVSDERVIDAYLGERASRKPREAAVAASLEAGTSAPEGPSAGGGVTEPLLHAREIVAGYLPDVDVIAGADVEAWPGEIVSIIGPNGAGKSTLLKALFGLLRIRSGDLRLHGRSIVNLPTHARVPLGIGYVPQLQNVFTTLTIEENLQMGLFLQPRRWRERLEAVSSLFPLVGDRRHQRVDTLSGGERQMVAIARALMMDPVVLLLDEPSAGLSPKNQDVLFDHIVEINRRGVTLVIVEQNARRALEISNRGYVLDQGRNAFQGPGPALLENPKVVELYLGTLAKVAT